MNAPFLNPSASNVKPFPSILRSGSASKFLQIRPDRDDWLLEEVSFPFALPVARCQTRGEATRTARKWTDRGIPALILT